jgi:hypothetical protein
MTPEQFITNRAEINRANSHLSAAPKAEPGSTVTPAEDPQASQLHLKSFTDEYRPEGATESHLVQALADTAWRLNRVAVLEVNLLTLAAANQPDPLDVDSAAIIAFIESQSKALANLSLHSQRLSRQFERTVAQLRDLQQTRRTQEKQDLDNLLNVMEMYESKGEPYRPSDDGFVFSPTQIKQAALRRNREHLMAKAGSA